MALLDGLAASERRRGDLFERARAGAAARDAAVVLGSAEALLVLRPPLAPAQTDDCLRLLRAAAIPAPLARRRDGAERRLLALAGGFAGAS